MVDGLTQPPQRKYSGKDPFSRRKGTKGTNYYRSTKVVRGGPTRF